MPKKYLKLAGILKQLLFDRGMKAVDLSREVHIPSPTIHRLVTGKSTRPYKSSLQPIADYFSLNVEQLIGEEPIGKASLERKEQVDLSLSGITSIPLVPWECLSVDTSYNKNLYEVIPFVGQISLHGFATIIQDSSMEPIFAPHCLLIFDPHRIPKDRSYILVQLHESTLFVFRQLLIDGDHHYLKPLNPDLNAFKMRLLAKGDKIISTLVEARQIYSDS